MTSDVVHVPGRMPTRARPADTRQSVRASPARAPAAAGRRPPAGGRGAVDAAPEAPPAHSKTAPVGVVPPPAPQPRAQEPPHEGPALAARHAVAAALAVPTLAALVLALAKTTSFPSAAALWAKDALEALAAGSAAARSAMAAAAGSAAASAAASLSQAAPQPVTWAPASLWEAVVSQGTRLVAPAPAPPPPAAFASPLAGLATACAVAAVATAAVVALAQAGFLPLALPHALSPRAKRGRGAPRVSATVRAAARTSSPTRFTSTGLPWAAVPQAGKGVISLASSTAGAVVLEAPKPSQPPVPAAAAALAPVPAPVRVISANKQEPPDAVTPSPGTARIRAVRAAWSQRLASLSPRSRMALPRADKKAAAAALAAPDGVKPASRLAVASPARPAHLVTAASDALSTAAPTPPPAAGWPTWADGSPARRAARGAAASPAPASPFPRVFGACLGPCSSGRAVAPGDDVPEPPPRFADDVCASPLATGLHLPPFGAALPSPPITDRVDAILDRLDRLVRAG